MADAKVRIDLIGGGRIMRALRGVRRAASTANTETRAEAQRTRRTVRATEREQQTTFSAQVARQRTLIREERERARVRAAAERAEQSSFRAQVARQRRAIRDERELARVRQAAERAEGPGRLRRMAGAMGRGAVVAAGGVLGAGRGALNATRSLQGTFGIRSQQEILGSAIDSRQRFVIAMTQGGASGPGGIAPHLSRVANIARRTGVAPEEIMGAIGSAQTRFNTIGEASAAGPRGLDAMFDQFEGLARVARATGSPLEDVQAAAHAFERQFDLTGPAVVDALNMVVDGATRGSLSLGDFANAMPQTIGVFRAARGTTGMEALAEFSALGQQLAGTELGAEQARTTQERFLAQLADPTVQRKLRRAGVEALDEEGNVRGIGDIVADIAAAPRLQTLSQIGRVFTAETSRGVAALAQADREGTTLNERIAAATPEAGAALVTETITNLEADASGAIIRQRIEREAQLIESSGELIESFGRLTGILTSLEDESPMLTTVGAPILEGAATGLGISALLSRLGGGAAASTAAGGGTGLAGGTAVGGASALGIAAAVAAGLAIAGAVTAAISATGWFEDQRGRSLLDQLGGSMGGPDSDSALGGGWTGGNILDAITEAISGPSVSDGSEAARINRQRALSATNREAADTQTKIDAASVRALAVAIGNEVRPAGAGRREEGSPGR